MATAGRTASRFAPRDARDRCIVALDMPTIGAAQALVDDLGEAVTFYKIGMQLAFAGGLDLIAPLTAAGKRVFLDMKLLDIDNTVAHAVESIAGLGATFTTIHAYPGAMRAAVRARGARPLGLLGVTVLTSMDDDDLAAAGYRSDVTSLVASRAADAADAGMDGLVCSAREAAQVRPAVGPGLLLVTPGIRPPGADAGDQKRTLAPGEAIANGADYLVVGRPIIAADAPASAADAIVAEIEAAL
ncbi:MAG: orotidine-5'-phosphate decarboxylase [Hyphomicrobiales bacterium]|nr:orotidine-5'-phosphate decarboxylase [Hyphomicrobiales bacterium]